MEVSLVIGADAEPGLISALADEMEKRGLVMPELGRTEPYNAKELCRETGLSDTQVRRMAGVGGPFERVEGTAAFLVKVPSVRKWQGFEAGKVSGK